MRIIELDGGRWLTVLDFYGALLSALGAPSWHGSSIASLVDSMIWGPIQFESSTSGSYPQDIREEVELAAHSIAEGRAEFQVRRGHDVLVRIEVVR